LKSPAPANFFEMSKYRTPQEIRRVGPGGAQATSGPFAKPGFVYRVDRVHMILGEGNFVLVVNAGLFGNKPASFYDLYRVEDDKITEH